MKSKTTLMKGFFIFLSSVASFRAAAIMMGPDDADLRVEGGSELALWVIIIILFIALVKKG